MACNSKAIGCWPKKTANDQPAYEGGRMRPVNDNGSSTTRPLVGEGDQGGAVRQYLGRLDAPHETHLRKRQKHPPSRIDLSALEAQSCRAREGVVVVVP